MQAPSSPIPPPSSSSQQEDKKGVIVDDDNDDDNNGDDMVMEDEEDEEDDDDDDDDDYKKSCASPLLNRDVLNVTTVLPSPTYVEEDEDGVYREYVVSDDDVDFAVELDREVEVNYGGGGARKSGTSSRKITSGTMSTMSPRQLKHLTMEDLSEEGNDDDDSDDNNNNEAKQQLPLVASLAKAASAEEERPTLPSLYYSTPKTAPRTMVVASSSAAAASAAASLSSPVGGREEATLSPTPFLTKFTPRATSPHPSHQQSLSSATSPKSHNRQLKQIQAMVASSGYINNNNFISGGEDNNNAAVTPIAAASSSSKSGKKTGRPLLRYMDIRKWGSGGGGSSSSSATRGTSSSRQQQQQDNRNRTEDVQQQQQLAAANAATTTVVDETTNLPDGQTSSSSPVSLLMVETNTGTSSAAHARSKSMESTSSVEGGGDRAGGAVVGSALTSSAMTSWDEDYLDINEVVDDDDSDDSDSVSDEDDVVDDEEEEDEEDDELFANTHHHDDDYYDDAYDSPDDDTTDFCYFNNPIDWNSFSAYPLPAHWLEEGTNPVVDEQGPLILGGSMPNMGYLHRRRSSAASTGSSDGVGGQQQQQRHLHTPSSRRSIPAIFTQHDADETVWEHGLLLQALWELLAERDQIGVEGSMEQSDNIWKKGPLKKLSTLTTAKISVNKWKVKYVELRRGNLCYYEDSGATSGRKIIHLRHTDTIVQACDRSSNNATGNSNNNTSIDKTNSTDNDSAFNNNTPSTVGGSGIHSAASVSNAATSGGAGDASSSNNNNANTNLAGGGIASKESTPAASSGGGNEHRVGEAKSSTGGGGRNSKLFCFEIIQPGSPKHVWMARSEEERQSWLQAIRGAMIGSLEGDVNTINHADDDGKRRKRQLDLVTHKKALDLYSHLRHDLQTTNITSPQQYCNIVYNAIRQLTVNSTVKNEPDAMDDDSNIHVDALIIPTLRVPVQWVRDQLVHAQQTTSSSGATSATIMSKAGSTHTTTTATSTTATTAAGRVLAGKAMAPHKKLKAVVADFWKNMGETTFGVNGLVLPKESPYASERTVGALCRCILEFDKAFNEDGEYDINQSGLISELQAVAYARNILMTVLKSKQQQDVACTINDLLNNDQVVLEPEPSEDSGIVHLEVSFAGDDLPDDQTDTENEISLWFRTRRKNSATSMWKRRFAVLSGVVLSYYEAATPRPHGLRGQLVLSGATVQQDESFLTADTSKDDKYVLLLTTAAEERWLSFEYEDDMKKWQVAIQESIDSCDAAPSLRSEGGGKNKGKSILKLTESVLKGAIPDSGIRVGAAVVRGATGSGVRVIRSAKDGSMKVFRTAVGMLRHKPSSASAAAMAHGGATTTASSISRRPSMQMLMSNAAPLGGGSGGNKREPTVQCVAEQTYSFAVMEAPEKPPPPNSTSVTDGQSTTTATTDPNLFREWKRETPPASTSSSSLTPQRLFTVNAKLFQAFLLTGGGKGGRLSRGDALIEMEFFFTSAFGGDDVAGAVVPATVKNNVNDTAEASQEEKQQRTMDFDEEYGFGGPITI